jgi:outer membrane protein
MKKLQLVLNAVLALAIIVLYILHFTSAGNKSNPKGIDTLKTISPANEGIVYINIDSVINNYQMYKDLSADFQTKFNNSDNQLKSKQTAFQKKVDDYKYKMGRGLLTRTEAADIEQSLAQEQQNLMNLQQQYEGQLAEEQQVANRKVINSIMEYLASLKGEKSYQFVLGTTFGGNILYANENYDITKSVTSGLNETYKKSAEATKTK